MAQEFDVPLGPDGTLPLPEPIRAALELADGQDVRFLLRDDGTVEVLAPPSAPPMADPQWLVSLRRATAQAKGEQIVALLGQSIFPGVLLWAALGLLVALEQKAPDAAELADAVATQLEQRAWRGDLELAELLRDKAAGKDRGRRSVPADLQNLPDLIDQDAYTGLGGFLNLDDGDVTPGELLEADPGFADELEEGNWLSVPAEGSRAAWSAMELFADLQEPRLRRRLLAAIEGRGAFRRFREAIDDEPEAVGCAWQQFSTERAAGRAVEWLASAGYDVAPRAQ